MPSSIAKPWIPDILALGFSLSSFLALIIVLAFQDGKPTFSWHGVTLNAIVSVLSTASKAALLFAVEDLLSQWNWIIFQGPAHRLIDFEYVDAASRGPWGSMKLLWRFRTRMTLIYLGGFTILISLAVDPFTQQLVQPRQGVVPLPDDATTVTKAGRYSKGSWYNSGVLQWDAGKDFGLNSAFVDADFSMQSAVLYGLNEPLDAVAQQAPFSCPTGNCTWAPYESLAVCSRCHDVRQGLQRLHTLGTLYSSLTDPGISSVAIDVGNTTVFRLPNGLAINNMDGWNPDGHHKGDAAAASPPPGSILMTTYGTANASQTVSGRDVDTLIWSMSMLQVAPDPAKPMDVWPDIPVVATECAVFYCVNKYEPIATNGQLVERISQVKEATRSPNSWKPLQSRIAEEMNPQTLASLEFDSYFSAFERSDLTLVSPGTGNKFNISNAAVTSISAYFQQTLARTLQVINDTKYSTAGRINGWYIKGQDGSAQYKPSWSQVLYSGNDLVQAFTSLAASMSNALRSRADGEFNGVKKVMTGQKEVATTFYRVVWPWIIVHGLSVAVGVLFVALTIWRNGTTQAWKSSSLAAMSRGGLMQVQQVLAGAHTVEQMEARAKAQRVALLVRKEGISVEDLELDPLQEPEH
ncbi:hypothetical protein F5Y17DRAFT_80490 [Xylariaceae sp. FL0594]|nr:hypothetical protein F5Y17DRAFT_80490 [Xylariaceae sp. FL0594]